jgi:hypothetical protein
VDLIQLVASSSSSSQAKEKVNVTVSLNSKWDDPVSSVDVHTEK